MGADAFPRPDLPVCLKDFDFELPNSSIALRPASPRDSARLLLVNPSAERPISQSHIHDLPACLRAGDVMVFNNTKVLRAEFEGYRASRGGGAPHVEISLTLVERLGDGAWKALARPGRRLRVGDVVIVGGRADGPALVVTGKNEDGEIVVAASGGMMIEAFMEAHGAMPLPPYIARARPPDERDRSDYQTVYACAPGAVAAPTAGLHFTPRLMERIAEKGVKIVFATLHVGAGTFLALKTEDINNHALHAEMCEISVDAARIINEGRAEGGRIIAVGTTSLRLLETAAREDGSVAAYRGLTALFIKPGHRFLSADVLLTNFHLPRSTLFMLVCAFSGTELMKKAYAHAVAAGFRFYSYGDACLLHRAAEVDEG